MINYIPDSCYTFKPLEGKRILPHKADVYPKILVSIGSGVSIIKIDSKNEFSRIGGTALGGATLLGLSNLLIGTNDFKEIQALCEEGDNSKVDTMFNELSEFGTEQELPTGLVACTFGKIATSELNGEELRN